MPALYFQQENSFAKRLLVSDRILNEGRSSFRLNVPNEGYNLWLKSPQNTPLNIARSIKGNVITTFIKPTMKETFAHALNLSKRWEKTCQLSSDEILQLAQQIKDYPDRIHHLSQYRKTSSKGTFPLDGELLTICRAYVA